MDKLLRCRHDWDNTGISHPSSIHYGKTVKNVFVFLSRYREWRWIVWKSRWHGCLRAARRTWLFPGLGVWRACGWWTLTPGWSGQMQMFSFSIRNWGRRGCSCRWGHSSEWLLKVSGSVLTVICLTPGFHGRLCWQQRKLSLNWSVSSNIMHCVHEFSARYRALLFLLEGGCFETTDMYTTALSHCPLLAITRFLRAYFYALIYCASIIQIKFESPTSTLIVLI